jgi:hypothetical protein
MPKRFQGQVVCGVWRPSKLFSREMHMSASFDPNIGGDAAYIAALNANAPPATNPGDTPIDESLAITDAQYISNFVTTVDPQRMDDGQSLNVSPNAINPVANRANIDFGGTSFVNGSGGLLLAGAAPKPVDIKSVGNQSQTDPSYVNEPYRFANIPLFRTDKTTLGSEGCTITALTNVLGYVADKKGLQAPQVTDTNNRNDAFFRTFDQARFTDLTGNNSKLGRRFEITNSIEGLNPSSRTRIATLEQVRDAKGNVVRETGEFGGAKLRATYTVPEPKVLTEVRNALREGKPVLLGLSKDADPNTRVRTGDARDDWGRHTVAAKGIDSNGEILVVDSSDGRTITLKQAMELWGDNNIDMAYKVDAK